MKKNVKRLKLWEVALLIGLGLSLLTGAWAEGTQTRLAGEVLRLHVIANSDSEEDQALKLKVRDAILVEAEELLEGCTTRQQALEVLFASTDRLQQQAAETVAGEGFSDPVAVTVEETWFPTKHYDGFSLPAGSYTALRVVIGAGEGHNWWCVVFPPLCLGASTEISQEAISAGVSQEDVALMTGEDGGYTLKFKTVELWEKLTHALRE